MADRYNAAARPRTACIQRPSIILVRGLGRRGRRSDYRREECPVVDSAIRRIEYAPPRPVDVPALMADLVDWWTRAGTARLPGPVRAGLLAHRFVSIHQPR